LRKNQRGGIVAIPVVQEDGGRHELRDGHKTYEQDHGGEHHLKDAEAPFAAASFVSAIAFLILCSRLPTTKPLQVPPAGAVQICRRRRAAKPPRDSRTRVARAAKVKHVGGQRQTAPRASKVTVLLAPDSVVRVLLAPSFDVSRPNFGGAPMEVELRNL